MALENLWLALPLWQKVGLYAYLLLALFTFVKTSTITMNGRQLIKTPYRALLAVFSPLVLVLGLVFGGIFLGVAACALVCVWAYSKITGKKIKISVKHLHRKGREVA